MFFRRSQPGEGATQPEEAAPQLREAAPRPGESVIVATNANGEATAVMAARRQPLPASELRRVVNPSSLGFKTTDDLTPINGLIGQERALKAIQFGTDIKSHDYNMFVLGPPASGKSTAVKAYLGPKAAESDKPAQVRIPQLEAESAGLRAIASPPAPVEDGVLVVSTLQVVIGGRLR